MKESKRILAFCFVLFSAVCLLAALALADFLKIPTTTRAVVIPAATATQVVGKTQAVDRVLIILVNQGANDCFYGRSNNVTQANGVLLKASGGYLNREAPYTDNGPFWVFSPLGTTVGVEEGYRQ